MEKKIMSKEVIMETINKMVSKMENEEYKERFSDFNKSLQFSFTDNKEANCYIVFEGGTATLKEGETEEPDLSLTTTAEIMMQILNGELSPTRAFMGGKLKAKGHMNDLMKLQALMK